MMRVFAVHERSTTRLLLTIIRFTYLFTYLRLTKLAAHKFIIGPIEAQCCREALDVSAEIH